MNIDPEAWEGWLEMRKAKRIPNTERALKLATNRLETFYNQGFDVNAILDQSTLRGWTGLFEVKDETSGTIVSKSDQRKAQAARQYIAGDLDERVVAINRNGP